MATAKVKGEEGARERYLEATGGRKTAIARVRLMSGDGITVNGRDLAEYFRGERERIIIRSPLVLVGEKARISAKVSGGGVSAQAEAVRNGLAKVLVKLNEDFKKRLRKAGFLTRDARMVERKKYGLKKARRAPQWQKR